jgi:hypothetical protein
MQAEANNGPFKEAGEAIFFGGNRANFLYIPVNC